MNDLTTVYKDVKITYSEHQNIWQAEDYRDKATLAEMKAAVDRKINSDGKQPKKKIPCYFAGGYNYGFAPDAGTTTGQNEDGSAWFTDEKGERKKIDRWKREHFFVRDAGADVVVAGVRGLESQIEALRKEARKQLGKLKRLFPD